MEQETKNKKQPNLKRVILWTTLISVVATLVLYYFSYIFPIPAVEIDSTGIPQTKEEYEQWYLKKLIIQNAKVPESDLEFGEKITSYMECYDGVIYLFKKNNKTYAFVTAKLYGKSYTIYYKHFSFAVENGDLLDFDFTNDYSNEKSFIDKSKIEIFSRGKENVFIYNLNGQLASKQYMPKETKYDVNRVTREYYLNRFFIKSDFSDISTEFKIPLHSDNFSIIRKRDYGGIASEIYYYIFDNNTITAYGYYMDLYDDRPAWRKIYPFTFLESPFNCSLINTSNGLYFFYYDSNEGKLSYHKISDNIIDMNLIFLSNDYEIQFINNLNTEDNYVNVKYIQIRDHIGTSYPYWDKENLIEWNYHIPGRFKWMSSYGNVVCTDKGLYTTQTAVSKIDFIKPKHTYHENKLDSFPYYNLFASRNFIYDKIEKLFDINFRDMGKKLLFYALGLFLIVGLIIIYINKDKHDKKVAEIEYYKQDDRYL